MATAAQPSAADVIAAGMKFGPNAGLAIQRSQYLADALKAMQADSASIRTPTALWSSLLADGITQWGKNRADKEAMTAYGADQRAQEDRLLADTPLAPGYTAPAPPAPSQQPAPQQAMPGPQAPAVAPASAPQTPPDPRLVKMMLTEAGGEGDTGMSAVGHVAMNRVAKGYGGAKSLAEVLGAPHQFNVDSANSNISPDSPRYQHAAALAAALSGEADPTNGATQFLNPELTQRLYGHTPSWADGSGQRIGHHVFYGGNPNAPQMAQNTAAPPGPPPPPDPNGPPVQNVQPYQVASNGPTPPPPGLIEPGNIDLNNRPVVHNPDGSVSTVRSISVGMGDKTVLIPTVVGGRVVSNEDAIKAFRQSGQHLGVFASSGAADAYAQQLHQRQAALYAPQQSSPPATSPQGMVGQAPAPANPLQGPGAGAGAPQTVPGTYIPMALWQQAQAYLRDPRTRDKGIAMIEELKQRAATPPDPSKPYWSSDGQAHYAPGTTFTDQPSPSPNQFVQRGPDNQIHVTGNAAFGAVPAGASMNGQGAISQQPVAPMKPYRIEGANGMFVNGPDGRPQKVAEDQYGPEQLLKMRQDLVTSEPVKLYQQAQDAYGSMVAAAKQNPGGMRAYALRDTFARAINPGAVARVGTIQAIRESQGLPAEIKGFFMNLQGDGNVPPEIAQQILDVTQGFVASHYRGARQLVDSNVDYAQRHKLDPADVTVPLGDEPQRFVIPHPQAPATASPGAGQAAAIQAEIARRKAAGVWKGQ